MFLNCTNKGCYANGEHTLDKTDNGVYCVECGESIDVPQTTKVILKSLGQVQRKVKSGVQFTCKALIILIDRFYERYPVMKAWLFAGNVMPN